MHELCEVWKQRKCEAWWCGLVSKALVVQHYAENDEEVTVSHTFYVDEMK